MNLTYGSISPDSNNSVKSPRDNFDDYHQNEFI